MMKTGRNAPCLCGSGKKYKKCCLGKQAALSQTLYYQRLSEAHDRLVKRLLTYATRIFGEEAVDVAMDEFLLWPDPENSAPMQNGMTPAGSSGSNFHGTATVIRAARGCPIRYWAAS